MLRGIFYDIRRYRSLLYQYAGAGALLFFLFHSLYPNRQERFILPAMPFIIMFGVIGWHHWQSKSAWWQKRQVISQQIWNGFWVFNACLLLLFSLTYTKKSRVESMCFLAKDNHIQSLILDGCHQKAPQQPLFYLQNYRTALFYYQLSVPISRIKLETVKHPADYVLFFESASLAQRVNKYKELYPKLHLVKKIDPSWLDQFIHWLNPINLNQTCYIYKTKF